MMECNQYDVIKVEDGKKYVKGTIYSDTTPSVMPENGDGIEGLSSDVMFATGMTFFSPDGMKMLFPSGWQDM